MSTCFKCSHDVIEDLEKISVCTSEWFAVAKICEFLEFAAHAIEAHFGSNYVIFSLVDRSFSKRENLYHSDTNHTDGELSFIASRLKRKLHSYGPYPRNPLSQFARVVHPRFSNDVLNDGQISQKFVTLRTLNEIIYDDTRGEVSDTPSECSIIEGTLDKNSCSFPGSDESVKFLCATTSKDYGAIAMERWRANRDRFPSIFVAVTNVLCKQFPFAASKISFSIADDFFGGKQYGLTDEMYARTCEFILWNRLLQ